MKADFECLTYCSLPYAGHGWTQTCVSVLANFAEAGIQPVLVTPRARRQLPQGIRLMQGLSPLAAKLPWKFVASHGQGRVEKLFESLIARADPDKTIAYFWPGAPISLVQRAARSGLLTVREMINCYQGTAKKLLDSAYAEAGLPPQRAITDGAVELERQELALYDYVFASNSLAEASLLEAGVRPDRILPASFGWTPSRYMSAQREAGPRRFRALFVGTLCVRKGVLDLLNAWKQADINGELLLVGGIEPAIEPMVRQALASGSVRHLPFTDDVGILYRNADIFVFPTLEEGGPQVTMEAAGCGLPSITTPMGAARLVRDGVNGLVVPPGDVEALAAAIEKMGRNPDLRKALARRATINAQEFAYDVVSLSRARQLNAVLQRRANLRSATAAE